MIEPVVFFCIYQQRNIRNRKVPFKSKEGALWLHFGSKEYIPELDRRWCCWFYKTYAKYEKSKSLGN